MALACNIDAAGRVARVRSGLILLAVGVVVSLAWALPTGSTAGWIVSAALGAAGAFALFEARAGWCAVRALGIKTRL
jgi:hypothetical protein